MRNKVDRSSLKHRVADEIKKTIFQGKLNPGDKITETNIANRLGVSRGPVREAIQILVMEGLLVSTTYTDTRVSYITTEEVMDLLIPMRINIETFSLKRGYSLWNQDTIAMFDQIIENMHDAINSVDLTYFNELDFQFHELIIKSSKMNTVLNLWEGVSNRIRLHFSYQNQLSSNKNKFLHDHKKLLESFKSGNLDEAVKSLTNHIVETNTPRVNLLPTQEDVDEIQFRRGYVSCVRASN